ncbi:MAG: hypothetical protein HC769_30790 [Cyanobacteria bacterium CRU_2_1]|nr:hypothetical protein [Cyanobacteria bacterium RU_5_0]NJR62792.1 hypothetical protein [Cyanobacteria bacterium CRU_2_1]
MSAAVEWWRSSKSSTLWQSHFAFRIISSLAGFAFGLGRYREAIYQLARLN